MSKVAKTKENLKKCICMKCPSYDFECKIKTLPSNLILVLGHTENKIHAEAMFCAYEKSSCLDVKNGCRCRECELTKDYNLDKEYYCLVTDGE